MPKSQPTNPPDLASPDPVLFWTGGFVGGVPQRDLDAGDLARIHRVRALTASGGAPVEPATADDLEAIATELSSGGAYARQAPATAPDQPAPIEPAAAPAPTEEPAAPAEGN